MIYTTFYSREMLTHLLNEPRKREKLKDCYARRPGHPFLPCETGGAEGPQGARAAAADAARLAGFRRRVPEGDPVADQAARRSGLRLRADHTLAAGLRLLQARCSAWSWTCSGKTDRCGVDIV